MIGRVGEGLAERLHDGLVALPGGRDVRCWRSPEDERQQRRDQDERCHHQQRRVPADAEDQRLAERREKELAGGGRGRDETIGGRAQMLRQHAGHRRHHQEQRRAGNADAEQHTGGKLKRDRAAGIGHQHEAERVEKRPEYQHAGRAKLVGDHADEGLGRAPGEVLDGDGQRENLASPAVLARHRRQEEAHGRARPAVQR